MLYETFEAAYAWAQYWNDRYGHQPIYIAQVPGGWTVTGKKPHITIEHAINIAMSIDTRFSVSFTNSLVNAGLVFA